MADIQGAAPRRRSRSVELLTKLLAANWFTIDEISHALVSDPRTVGRYLSGEIEMPPERQVFFANFLIERVPPFARQGRNLLSQVKAAMEFANSPTKVHRD